MGTDLIDSNSPKQPAPGDVCLRCTHKPKPEAAAYFHIPGGLAFRRPDGTEATAGWFLICGRCAGEYQGDVAGAIDRRNIHINNDLTWPEGLVVSLASKEH